MALRWLILACIVSLAVAQNDTNATEAPVTMPTTMEVTMTTPMVTMAPEGTTLSPVMAAQLNESVGERYVRPQAEEVRREHFFCPPQGGSFVMDTFGADMARTANVWSLFLQYPVLAYLDSVKKQALVGQIVALLNAGGQPRITTDNICIGLVFHYDVSLYTESVLLNIYLRDIIPPAITVEQINSAFRNGIGSSPTIIRLFQGRQAIMISSSTYGMIQQNVHPGAFRDGERFPEIEDPTLNAVILGYWPRQYNLDEIAMDAAINGSIVFAQNPNPVFYGLTGGDVVFIVIATLLCSLLAFLMVFGFCIQPFFM